MTSPTPTNSVVLYDPFDQALQANGVVENDTVRRGQEGDLPRAPGEAVDRHHVHRHRGKGPAAALKKPGRARERGQERLLH